MAEQYVSYAEKKRQLEEDFGNFERMHHAYELLFGQPISFKEGAVTFSDSTPTEQDIANEKTKDNTKLITGELLRKDGKPKTFRQNPNLLAQFFEEDKFKGVRLTQHQITFRIPKGSSDDGGEIVLYNITDNVRQTLVQYGTNLPTVQLKAGYITQVELPLLFQGEVTKIVETFEGPTRVTRLSVKTGSTNIKEAYTVRTFKAGTSLDTIIRTLIGDMKLAYGTIYLPRSESGEIVIDKNFLVNGHVYSALKRFEREYGLQIFLDNGTVNVTPDIRKQLDSEFGYFNLQALNARSPATALTIGNSPDFIPNTTDPNNPNFIPNPPQDLDFLVKQGRADNISFPDRSARIVTYEPVEELSTKNGNIIGSPVTEADSTLKLEDMQRPPKVKVKTQLNGNYKLDQRVVVESAFVTGVYVIKKIDHVGNYEGADWYTQLELDADADWAVRQ